MAEKVLVGASAPNSAREFAAAVSRFEVAAKSVESLAERLSSSGSWQGQTAQLFARERQQFTQRMTAMRQALSRIGQAAQAVIQAIEETDLQGTGQIPDAPDAAAATDTTAGPVIQTAAALPMTTDSGPRGDDSPLLGAPGSPTRFAGGGSLFDTSSANNVPPDDFHRRIAEIAQQRANDTSDDPYRDNCTNFVSDVLAAAGLPQTTGPGHSGFQPLSGDNTPRYWWHDPSSSVLPWMAGHERSQSWSFAPDLFRYLTQTVHAQEIPVSQARPGDVIFWQKPDGTFHHAAVITGVADGDLLYTQHSGARDDWSLQRGETDFTRQPGVGPQVLHILRVPTPSRIAPQHDDPWHPLEGE